MSKTLPSAPPKQPQLGPAWQATPGNTRSPKTHSLKLIRKSRLGASPGNWPLLSKASRSKETKESRGGSGFKRHTVHVTNGPEQGPGPQGHYGTISDDTVGTVGPPEAPSVGTVGIWGAAPHSLERHVAAVEATEQEGSTSPAAASRARQSPRDSTPEPPHTTPPPAPRSPRAAPLPLGRRAPRVHALGLGGRRGGQGQAGA